MLTQALLALLGLVAGAWILLFPSRPSTSPSSFLTTSINFTAAAYLLCEISFVRAETPSHLVLIEKASTGFFIMTIAILPWALEFAATKRRLLKGHSIFALLLLANFLSPVSSKYHQLIPSGLDSKIIRSEPPSFSLALLILALSCSLLTARKAIRSRRDTSKKLTALILSTAIATTFFAAMDIKQNRETRPHDNLMWIAICMIAATNTWVYFSEKRKTLSKRSEEISTEYDPTKKTDHEPPQNYQKRAILLNLEENDAYFASKILISKGYTVMIENELTPILPSFFETEQIRLTVIFNRDYEQTLKRCIPEISFQIKDRVALFASTRRPRSPSLMREIRRGHYLAAIQSPLKATELFSILESHIEDDFNWTHRYHPSLSE